MVNVNSVCTTEWLSSPWECLPPVYPSSEDIFLLLCHAQNHMQHTQWLQDIHYPSSTVSLLQLRQKLVTRSLSSRDPITTLNSLPVTLLIHSYLHMKPRECEANCCSAPLPRSFLSIQYVTSPFFPPVCSLCGWHSVPLLDCQSCSGKLSNYNLNFPAESLLIQSWERETEGRLDQKKKR